MPFLLSNKNPYSLTSEHLGNKIVGMALAYIGKHCWQVAIAKPSAHHVFSSTCKKNPAGALLPQYWASPLGDSDDGYEHNGYEDADHAVSGLLQHSAYPIYFNRLWTLDRQHSRVRQSPRSLRIKTKRDFYAAFLFNDPSALERFQYGNNLFINCEEFIYFIFYQADIFSIDGLRMLARQSGDFKSVLWRNCKRRFLLDEFRRNPQDGDLVFFYERKSRRLLSEDIFHHVGIYRHDHLCISLENCGAGALCDFSVFEKHIVQICAKDRSFFVIPPHVFIREMLELLGSNKYTMTNEEIEEIQETNRERPLP